MSQIFLKKEDYEKREKKMKKNICEVFKMELKSQINELRNEFKSDLSNLLKNELDQQL